MQRSKGFMRHRRHANTCSCRINRRRFISITILWRVTLWIDSGLPEVCMSWGRSDCEESMICIVRRLFRLWRRWQSTLDDLYYQVRTIVPWAMAISGTICSPLWRSAVVTIIWSSTFAHCLVLLHNSRCIYPLTKSVVIKVIRRLNESVLINPCKSLLLRSYRTFI